MSVTLYTKNCSQPVPVLQVWRVNAMFTVFNHIDREFLFVANMAATGTASQWIPRE